MFETTRADLSNRIEALALPQAKAYAGFVRAGDPGGPTPCWGAIAERFTREFAEDAHRLDLWDSLIAAGDRRPLLLFLYLNQDRPAVMARVLADAHKLPRVLQRALVCIESVASELPAVLERLDPAARQLAEAGPTALAKERELALARVKELLAFRYFVPDRNDPAHEAARSNAIARGPASASPAVEAATPPPTTTEDEPRGGV